MARFARLVRYRVPSQRVQSSCFDPQNGL